MFLLRMIQYLLGTVRLRAEGGSPEKFLNLVAQRDISLWDIRLKDGMLTAGALSRSLKRLRPLAGQAGVVLSVEARKGLPHLAKRFAGRTGLLIGTVLFLALVWFFSSFIWEIDITGNLSLIHI